MVSTGMCKPDDYGQPIISWRPSLPPPYTRCAYGIVWRRSVCGLCRPLPRAGRGPFLCRLRWRQEQQSSRLLLSKAIIAEQRAQSNHHTALRCFSIRRHSDRIPIGRDRGIMNITANTCKGHDYRRIAFWYHGHNEGNLELNLSLIFEVDWILSWNHID